MDRLYFLLPAVLAAILLGGRGLVSCAFAADKPGQAIGFEFSLAEAAKTSAGVFDADGRLVRALWAIENLKVGKHKKTWDGLDDFGKEAPAGEYQFRVVLNGATYRTVGAIGNSGKPPSAAGHTPVNMLSLALDDEGGIYTANMWDEAGADFKKWNPEGESVFDSHYGVRNGKPYGLPYAITVDDKYIFVSVHGMARGLSVAHQQIRRFNRSDGKLAKFPKVPREDGHIAVYDWPRKMTPNPSTPGEATYLSNPLRSLAIVGDTLLVADAVGRILKYDKETGEPRGEFRVEAPRALAVDKKGQIWVGHKRNLVSVYDLKGKLLRKAISNIGEVASLAFGWSKAWPYPQGNPFWMGGTTLARFDKSGKRLWAVHLPAVVVGLDVIPGPDGGCMVGGGRSATIYHYSADGLLINTMTPGEAMNKETGWLDNHASVAISRDPRDKMLDVFVEDDHVCRIGWYRVDDRNITTISGPLKKTASPPAGD